MEISVHNLDNNLFITETDIFKLVEQTIRKLGMEMQSVNIIFVGDERLRAMHDHFLDDPDYTDVMTFNLGEDVIEGEIYISKDRVKDNAKIFDVSIKNEIFRTIIHGLLHLKGYTDEKDHQKKIMKQKEDELLNQLYNA